MPNSRGVTVARIRSTGAFVVLCGSLALSASAHAQVRCLEGRTLSGECVNAALALTVRQTTIIFAQPKISATAFPVLPSDDYRFRYPYDLIPNELRAFTGARPGGSQ